jgi:N-carbamoylputrescine amidase
MACSENTEKNIARAENLIRQAAKQGAQIILIQELFSTPYFCKDEKEFDYSPQWQHVMQGHAAANVIPVCASNRVGLEKGESCEINFFGRSFIADESGTTVAEADREEETVLTVAFDFEEIRKRRSWFSLFRDRRPEMYDVLLTLDGRRSHK